MKTECILNRNLSTFFNFDDFDKVKMRKNLTFSSLGGSFVKDFGQFMDEWLTLAMV